MGEPKQARSQTALARGIVGVLRLGTLSAIALVLIGYAWAAVSGQTRGGTRPVLGEISAGGGDGLTAIGLVALTLLPIIMLAVSAAAFRRAGERRMAAIAVLVGALLIASLVAAAVIDPAI